ncbi:type I restriction-modification system subunit M [Virgibacillus profundi]|uniref:site-specific DNA-methyltransferase (adenine-specific) n=1 Tax=Virgibacillus profundi TaxID=2024555 RepID=A0A2A2I809_9BACI|nr:type I restriction-modification system subunit M [Virgibacillus profundi]PAV27787.1 type I restriction-modification system subunit M [Virgibacillus profundi]PXY52009.1 type I restriction-modification system subunit M [Virgibacillus profundi]
MITSDDIKRRLWDGANDLRGSMDASRYKDYMLGLMFYKFLSDKTLETFKTTSGVKGKEEDVVQAYEEAYENYGDNLTQMIQNVLGYYVLPKHLYQTWLKDIREGAFELEKVTESLQSFERTVATTGDIDDFKGLFASSTIDLTDTALGSNLNARSKNIRKLIELFADLNMVTLQKGDVLGDAYEYLIGQFAMESGKKAGEFYTPRQVSEVMAQIVAKTTDINSIYDPTVGSGSLLLTVSRHLTEDNRKDLHYYGQEKNTATYNLTRMNLLLHGVRPEKMTVNNGDTLGQDWPEDPERPNEGVQFDAVVMNPPYSLKNWNQEELKVTDPRFEVAGVLPPDSKGDYAFLLHGLFHLGQEGTMAIVLPHGVLFRGGAEGEIRKRLLDKNYIDTVIGLPDKLFTNTGIPVTVMILKKNRELNDPVLMIDASKSFVKEGKQHVLQEKDIAKIVDTYIERTSEPGYSYQVTKKDIKENEYNLNIPRYIDVVEEDIAHDVDGHLYGGIPLSQIKKLTVLHDMTKDVLYDALTEVRPGYVEVTQDVQELTEKVLSHENVQNQIKALTEVTKVYMATYWEKLKAVPDVNAIEPLKEEMLTEMKQLLKQFNHVSTYAGYQIIAELWGNTLSEDTEKIVISEFYTVGKTREANMVTKGSGKTKRTEQDGWLGAIVPNELILKELYTEELNDVETKKDALAGLNDEINELVEAAKVEESEEAEALGDALNAREDDFTLSAVRAEIKKVVKDTDEYALLDKVRKLLDERSSLNKAIREKDKALTEQVEERIANLTREEIDQLMYKKWFGQLIGDITKLVEVPLKNEIDTLKELKERYADTLETIEEESKSLEAQFEAMLQELVVTE